jgi:hypothetical protein
LAAVSRPAPQTSRIRRFHRGCRQAQSSTRPRMLTRPAVRSFNGRGPCGPTYHLTGCLLLPLCRMRPI